MIRLATLRTLALAAALAACDKTPANVPLPQEISESSTAQFCGMLLTEHGGPKGQVFVRDQSKPLWFASVRDTIAFLRLPEMPKDVVVVYVNDMGRARNWQRPEPGTWVDAQRALYVIGSGRTSGMGTQEAMPFAERSAAQQFAAVHGGHVVALADIPDSYIFADNGGGS
jgi:copper chaperone NosL